MTFATYNRQIDGWIIDTVRSLVEYGKAVDAEFFGDINEWIADRRFVMIQSDIVQALLVAFDETTAPLRDDLSRILDAIHPVFCQVMDLLEVVWFILSLLACLVMMLVPEWTDSDMAEYIRQAQVHDLAVECENAIALSEVEAAVAVQIEAISQQTAIEIEAIQVSAAVIGSDTQQESVSERPDFFTMNKPSLEQWASDNGISCGQVGRYGDLRLKKTWRKALDALVA